MDSRIATYEHIQTVQKIMGGVIGELQHRQQIHDQSKLASPEREVFDEFTPRLAASTYGSDEYKGFLAGMKPALDHHYAKNDHHPEFFGVDVCVQCGAKQSVQPCSCGGPRRASLEGMDLIQMLEMCCDWKAATMRHADGDLLKSIEINQSRFGYSDELKRILLNTVKRYIP